MFIDVSLSHILMLNIPCNLNFLQTNIQNQPQVETLHVKSAVPEVHHEVQHVQPAVVHKKTVSVPQVKATTSHVETQGKR